MKILVTTHPYDRDIIVKNSFEAHFNEKKSKYTRQEVLERIAKVNPDYIIAGTEKYDAELLDHAPNLKMISRVGIGTDSIDFDETKKRNIEVYNTPKAPITAVAKHVETMALSLAKKIPQMHAAMKKGEWKRITGRDLSDLTVGIIGFGNIGQQVYNMMKGQGVSDFQVYDPYSTKIPNLDEANDLYALLANSDLVTLHIPKTEHTENLIRKEELMNMKEDAILINTSRGGIIDEIALYNHLQEFPEFSAGLDVFSVEPYYGTLSQLDNLIITPHVATQTVKTRSQMEFDAYMNVVNFHHKLTGRVDERQ